MVAPPGIGIFTNSPIKLLTNVKAGQNKRAKSYQTQFILQLNIRLISLCTPILAENALEATYPAISTKMISPRITCQDISCSHQILLIHRNAPAKIAKKAKTIVWVCEEALDLCVPVYGDNMGEFAAVSVLPPSFSVSSPHQNDANNQSHNRNNSSTDIWEFYICFVKIPCTKQPHHLAQNFDSAVYTHERTLVSFGKF